jgi:AcrR family transcriptional regulator
MEGHAPSGSGDGDTGGKRAYRMRARREAVERTRERILRAVYDLWLARPYDELTVEAVAEAAGVSRQTVHRHFGSKDDLALATADWRGPREDLEREVPPGDVRAAVRRLVERYEEMGDANIRFLELEGRLPVADYSLKQGREAHRAWIEQVFAPRLPRRGGARERAVLALYAATDVTVWKLLRRDFGQSPADTEAVIRALVEGVLSRTETTHEETTP